MLNPKITVVMPAWNAEKTIANAVNSIINQIFQDWELIIVNDGSIDKTSSEASKFQDERIIIFNDIHKGLVSARNKGCELAKSEIIVTQDADDLSMPDRLEKIYQIMSLDKFDVLYHGAYINMWDIQFNCIGRKYLPATSFDKKKLLEGQYTNGWYVFKKYAWEKKSFRMETQYAYDWMAILDWAYSGLKIFGLNVGLYEYVRHENSASITYEKDGRRQQSINKIKEIMKKEYGVSM